ncbi:MAG: hypothetical protein M1497_10790 [Nitrospirae bacterium]|nr:hypothetical protein [Nitrospirota bacterium]
MKTSVCVALFFSALFIVGEVWSQTVDGYTFVTGESGTLACLGTWVPSRDVALPGTCEGQLVSVDRLSALSARLSADRLNQALLSLGSVDQRLAVSNDQLNRLIEAVVNTQAAIDRLTDLLSRTISERFEGLSQELLANEAFREALAGLKEDILREVEKQFPRQPGPDKGK